MKVFYSETHRRHNPPFEVFDGGMRAPYMEDPARMDSILQALHGTSWARIVTPDDFGLQPILAVHAADYMDFLASAWNEWLAMSPEAQTSPSEAGLLPATFALRRLPHRPASLLGRAGYYMMDLSAVLTGGTYEASLASANCALSGAQAIADDNSRAFALGRPPGHHAGLDYAAGYCFINNAAVAAHWLSARGKVAILDVDYHMGNGTQDIFYHRSDVLTISIHADPSYEYPYYAGYADETGVGKGVGFHHNYPLPAGTVEAAYLAVLDDALGRISRFAPRYLVVSAGMDIYEHDSLGKFKISTKGIGAIGAHIAQLGLPTLIIMEGGYNNAALGKNVVSFLSSFV